MILSFNPQFVPKIISGIKIHTLRDDPSDRWQPGIKIHMATGMRTANYNCFEDKHNCISIQKVVMGLYGENIIVEIDGRELPHQELYDFFIKDGFNWYKDFYNWFAPIIKKKGGKYCPKLIHWTDFKYQGKEAAA
jgi:hypothetical protein